MIEYAIGLVGGFGLGLSTKIARTPLLNIERPSDVAFQLAPHDAPKARRGVWARLIAPVIALAARSDKRP